MRKRVLVWFGVAAILLLGGFSAVQLLPGGSAGGTLATGRSIMAHTDSIYIAMVMGGDTGTIKTSGKTIVVRPKNIEIDRNNVATIDESCKKIEVRVQQGRVSFRADGQPVDNNRG